MTQSLTEKCCSCQFACEINMTQVICLTHSHPPPPSPIFSFSWFIKNIHILHFISLLYFCVWYATVLLLSLLSTCLCVFYIPSFYSMPLFVYSYSSSLPFLVDFTLFFCTLVFVCVFRLPCTSFLPFFSPLLFFIVCPRKLVGFNWR